MSKATFILLAVLAVQTSATIVKSCTNGANDNQSVSISGCKGPTCTVKKGTKVTITIKFKPTAKVDSLTTHVTAKLSLFTVPYPALDGKSACNNIYRADNNAAVSCPLPAGVEYIYKGVFDIDKSYPSITVEVRYALQSNSKDVACFKVDIKVTD